MPKQFSNLESLIKAWFHRDFDIPGDTLEEIMVV